MKLSCCDNFEVVDETNTATKIRHENIPQQIFFSWCVKKQDDLAGYGNYGITLKGI